MRVRDSTCRARRVGLRARLEPLGAIAALAGACAAIVTACATVHPPGGGPGAPSGDGGASDAGAAADAGRATTAGADAARAHRPSKSRGAPATVGATQSGLATYYSDKLRGHKTANGDRYDPAGLTAAHRTLPLGTWVEVSTDDGNTVRVRINDRGPFGDEDRIIDLSKRAARELGILKKGVAHVTVRVVAGSE